MELFHPMHETEISSCLLCFVDGHFAEVLALCSLRDRTTVGSRIREDLKRKTRPLRHNL